VLLIAFLSYIYWKKIKNQRLNARNSTGYQSAKKTETQEATERVDIRVLEEKESRPSSQDSSPTRLILNKEDEEDQGQGQDSSQKTDNNLAESCDILPVENDIDLVRSMSVHTSQKNLI